jgi:hypothetical protein
MNPWKKFGHATLPKTTYIETEQVLTKQHEINENETKYNKKQTLTLITKQVPGDEW